MTGVERRIKSLEVALGVNVCPVCGHDPEKPLIDIEVVWEDIDADEPPDQLADQPDKPEHCHGCGQQLEWIVTWQDLPPIPPHREEHEHDD